MCQEFLHFLYILGSYSDSYSSDDETTPRDQVQVISNSNGFKDFCIKDIKLASYGRKEIGIAEKGKLLAIIGCIYTCICK